MESLLGLSWELLLQLALLAGVSCGVFLGGLGVGWRVTCALARPITSRLAPSHIPETLTRGEWLSLISALSRSGSADDSTTTLPAPGPSSGSSSSSSEAPRTSTSSAPTSSRETGYRQRGSISWPAAIAAIFMRERTSNRSAAVGPEPSTTPKSTLSSGNRKPCRLCMQIRGLAAGGAFLASKSARELPQERISKPSARKTCKSQSQSSKKPSRKPRKGVRLDSGAGSTPTSGSSSTSE